MITLCNIEKSFAGHRVLQNIHLTVAEGTVTALIGPSGSGKSTLLRCINLLEIPQSGELTIGKEEIVFTPDARIKGQDIRRMSRQTGMVFQNFALFPHMTTLDNITEGLITVHMATHDLRLAAHIASQVVFLEAGEIVESGSASTLFSQAKKPRTTEFIASLSTAFSTIEAHQ